MIDRVLHLYEFTGIMMSIKDWVLSQLVSNSVASARPLSGSDNFFEGELPSNEFNVPGMTHFRFLDCILHNFRCMFPF